MPDFDVTQPAKLGDLVIDKASLQPWRVPPLIASNGACQRVSDMRRPGLLEVFNRVFQKNCAICHKASGENRTPTPEALMRLPRKSIMDALQNGSMKAQGALLSATEREAVADYLTVGTAPASDVARNNACPDFKVALSSLSGWNGWGVDLENTRFQSATTASITAGQVPSLKLKWAFGIAGTGVMYGQPTLADGGLFFGAWDGMVYALDAQTGCQHWTFKAPATVRRALS